MCLTWNARVDLVGVVGDGERRESDGEGAALDHTLGMGGDELSKFSILPL